MEIIKYKTPHELAEAVAYNLQAKIKQKVELVEQFYLAVSGGSTPKILFELLSRDPFSDEILWQFLHIFWVDERSVPPADSESNYGMTKKILLDKVNIPFENIHRIIGEDNPSKEIYRYAEEIEQHVKFKNNLPSFDWILLGMGSDGHTASIFPESPLKEIAKNITAVSEHPASKQKRITLTEAVINNAEEVIFLVTGSDKAATLNKIFSGDSQANKYPAARIKPIHGKLQWLIAVD